MKHSALLLFTAIATLTNLTYAKQKNPADYKLVVHVLSSAHETELVYRGTDCTSTGYGEIDESDTLAARVYTTCSPDLAAHQYVFTEFDVTNTDPAINNTVRFLGQCADVSGAALASNILGGLGNAMAAAGGTPEQQAQADRRARRTQPLPPSGKCYLALGDYAGRWQKGKLELLVAQSNKKYTSVRFIVAAVTIKQNSTSVQSSVTAKQKLATAPPTLELSQDCPPRMTRVATSYGSYCKGQDDSASKNDIFASAHAEASPTLTHSHFSDSGPTQACPQGMTRIPTSYGSYCGTVAQMDSALTQTLPKPKETPNSPAASKADTQCHFLIMQLNEATARFDLNTANANMEQQAARMKQLEDWTEQLDACVMQSPGELSLEDWQHTVLLQGELQSEFYKSSAAINAASGSNIVSNLDPSCRANDQQWLNDYNDLVHRYNALVREYNDQRALIIRLIATPPPLPSTPTFVHCSTLNFGTIGSIDCY